MKYCYFPFHFGVFMFKKIALAAIVLSVSTTASANNSAVTINDLSSGYPTYYYSNPALQNIETHVIGIYESSSDHSSEGTVFVHISGSASTPVNLVLSSYESTKWVLDGDGLSFLDSIIVNGYKVSRVIGGESSIVIHKTGSGSYLSACGYALPENGGGCGTQSLINGVESYYGTKISTFTGDYRATDFSLVLSPVPEPSSIVLLSCGLIALGFYRRRYIGDAAA
jgi:hypothetical protein